MIATLLWEVIRHVLVWYFDRLSMANVMYGPMAAVIVVLLTLEAAALILLLGAQVIAEADRARTGPARGGSESTVSLRRVREEDHECVKQSEVPAGLHG